jgi:hypothetical protein
MAPAVSVDVSEDNVSDAYEVKEIIRDPDGIIATITERRRDGQISFAIAREFEKDSKTTRTAFLRRRHLPALQRVVNELGERLELAEDRARARRR